MHLISERIRYYGSNLVLKPRHLPSQFGWVHSMKNHTNVNVSNRSPAVDERAEHEGRDYAEPVILQCSSKRSLDAFPVVNIQSFVFRPGGRFMA